MIVSRYYEALNLKCNPFSLVPDPDIFFLMASHAEAIDTIFFAYDNDTPMVRIIGDPGTGKTMLLKFAKKKFLEERGIKAVYLSYNPLLSISDFAQQLDGIGDFEGAVAVLIDEAQDMGVDYFLILKHRLDSVSLQGKGRFFVVVAGTSKLTELFEEEAMRPMAQRSPYACELYGLRKEELAGYIDFRLRHAGFSGELPFTKWALNLIWSRTKGNPRLVNILAERSLLAAMVSGRRKVKRKDVKTAIKDLPRAL